MSNRRHSPVRRRPDLARAADAVRRLLDALGQDPAREGLRETPRRVAEYYAEILSGERCDPDEVLTVHFAEEDYQELVLEKDITFYSLCEHHLLPFFGRVHIAYIPDRTRLLGISKLARIVDIYARRLQVQERMTRAIAETIMKKAQPLGVIVVCEAEHLCLSMRGVRKPGHTIVTSCMRGIFLKDLRARMEVLELIKR